MESDIGDGNECFSIIDRGKIQEEIARINQLTQDGSEFKYTSENKEFDENESGDESEEEEESQDGHEDESIEEGFTPLEFNEVPTSLDGCCIMNRVYQEFIRSHIQRLELCLAENREKQKTLQEELNNMAKKKKRACGNARIDRPYTIFCIPYFKDKKGFAQPYNEDAKQKLSTQGVDAFVHPALTWSSNELNLLHNSVKAVSLEEAHRSIMNRKEIHMEKISKPGCSMDTKKEAEMKLADLEGDLIKMKNLDEKELLGPRWKSHDWMKISVVDFEGSRTARECELMWKNFKHPDITVGSWSSDEDAKLNDLVNKHGNNWDLIATDLKTGRTAQQCIERYQSEINDQFIKSKWSPEEDATLLQIIESCRIGTYIPWHQVMYYMEGRTRNQVARRWFECLNPNLKKGQWSEKEDMMLIAAVAKFGHQNWTIIKEYIPGRTPSACRDRWSNCLSYDVRFSHWSAKEDQYLIKTVAEFGSKWAQIATRFPGRTDSMVSKRYGVLSSRMALSSGAAELKDEFVQPRTSQCHKANRYRNYIYNKLRNYLLQITGENAEDGITACGSILDESTAKLLSIKNSRQLELLIGKLKDKCKVVIKRRPNYATGRPRTNHTPEDLALMEFFKFANKKRGRPFIRAPIPDGDPKMISITTQYLQIFGSNCQLQPIVSDNGLKTTGSASEASPLINSGDSASLVEMQDHNYNLKNLLLPPSLPLLIAFKNILLSRDQLVQSVEETFNDEKSQDTKSSITIANNIHFRNLCRRFMSLFFWPAFVSTIKLEIEEKPRTKRRPDLFMKRTLRTRRKPWIAEIMRQRHLKNKKPTDEDKSSESTAEIAENSTAEPSNGPVKKRRGRPVGCKVKKKEYIVAEPRRSSRFKNDA